MEVADESSNAGEVVCVEDSQDLRRFGLDGGYVVVFGYEREAPQLGTGGVSPSLIRMVLLFLEYTVTALLSNRTVQL